MKDLILEHLVFILVGIGIALLGIFIQKSRSYSIIAGYNTMSAEKRKKVNIEQVAIATRNTFIVLGLVWIFVPIVSEYLGYSKIKYWLLVGIHIVGLVLLVIVINIGRKYKRNP
jgi:hypothetical protein